MIYEIKYEKLGNLEIFKKKKGIAIYSTRNCTDYSLDMVKKLIYKFKDKFVFYFTYDFYLRSSLYKFKNIDFQKVMVVEESFNLNTFKSNSEAHIILKENIENRRLRYLYKDLVILNFVSKIIILEATKFSKNLKILSEIATENSIDVFCLPGKLTDTSSYGTNKMIFDGGIPLFDFELLNS